MCSLTKGQLQASQPCRQHQILPSHGWRKSQGRNISRHQLGSDAPATGMHGYPRPRAGSLLSWMDLCHSIRTGSNSSPLWFCCLHRFAFLKLVSTLLEPKESPTIQLLFLKSEAKSTGSWMCYVLSLANITSEQKASKAILRPSNVRKSPVAKARRPEGKRERHAFPGRTHAHQVRDNPKLQYMQLCSLLLMWGSCRTVALSCRIAAAAWLQQAVMKKQLLVRRWTDR